MPYPTQPALSYVVSSSTSFTASVAGGDAGVTNRLFYRQVGATSDSTGPTRTGNGAFSAVSSLTANGQYVAYVVSDDGSSYSRPSFIYVSLAQTVNTLTAGIHSKFSGNGALVAAISGGLWTGEVPEGTAPPYAWLDIDYLNSEPLFGDYQFEAGKFRVSIFGIGAQSAEACAAQFKAVFDYDIIPFSVGTGTICIQLMPRQYTLRCENLRYKNSQLIYRATLTYHVLIAKPR